VAFPVTFKVPRDDASGLIGKGGSVVAEIRTTLGLTPHFGPTGGAALGQPRQPLFKITTASSGVVVKCPTVEIAGPLEFCLAVSYPLDRTAPVAARLTVRLALA